VVIPVLSYSYGWHGANRLQGEVGMDNLLNYSMIVFKVTPNIEEYFKGWVVGDNAEELFKKVWLDALDKMRTYSYNPGIKYLCLEELNNLYLTAKNQHDGLILGDYHAFMNHLFEDGALTFDGFETQEYEPALEIN